MSVVLLTGCSSGFGRAAAETMAAAGHQVVATMRDPSRAGDLVDRPGVVVDQLDVVDDGSRAGVVARTLDRFGSIDVLVNNAGIGVHGPAEEIPDHLVRQQFETNFFGPLALVKAVLPSMIDGSTGRIVNVTSIGGVLSSGFLSTYCASKHALDALSLGLDIELQPFGIRVVTVAPGGFNTSMAANRPAVDLTGSRYPRAKQARQSHDQRLAVSNDLSPVAEAILAASFDEPPRARYLVGGGTADLLHPMLAEGEKIHQLLRDRDA